MASVGFSLCLKSDRHKKNCFKAQKRNLTKAAVINNFVTGKSCKLGECRRTGCEPLGQASRWMRQFRHLRATLGSHYTLKWRAVVHLLPCGPPLPPRSTPTWRTQSQCGRRLAWTSRGLRADLGGNGQAHRRWTWGTRDKGNTGALLQLVGIEVLDGYPGSARLCPCS